MALVDPMDADAPQSVAATTAYIDALPEEMLVLLLAPLGAAGLCRLSCTCSRVRALVASDAAESLWAAAHQRRWRLPATPRPLSTGWRADY